MGASSGCGRSVPASFDEWSFWMRRYLGYAMAGLLMIACGQSGDSRGTSTMKDGAMSEQSADAAAPAMAPAPSSEEGRGSAANTAPAARLMQSSASRDTGTTGAPVMIIRTGHASVEVG